MLQGLLRGVSIAGTVAPPLDGLTPTGAWSPSRKLMTAYGGSFYTLTTGHVSTLFDQSGFVRNQIDQGSGTTPTIDSSGVVALSYNGSTDWLGCVSAMTNFVTLTSGYIIASVKPTGFSTDTGTIYLNATVVEDNGENVGMVVRDNAGSPLLYSVNNSQFPQNSIVANVPYVMEWRHDGGFVYSRLNGSSETSLATGDSNLGGGLLSIGGRQFANGFQGLIYEVVIFSSVPTLAQRNALVQSLGTYVGASV